MMCGVFQNGTSFVCAQTAIEKGLNSINRVSAETIIGFLADDELQGREAGTIYSRIAARYLAASLKVFMVIVIFNLLRLMRKKDNIKGHVGKYILIL